MIILKKHSDIASKFKPAKYEELRETQKRTINFTVFYIGLFFALLFNYVLTLYMGSMLVSKFKEANSILQAYAFDTGIRLFDKIGFEVHFIRLLYYTAFDVDLHERHHYPPLLSDFALVLDLFFLFLIILPLFILSLRYLSAPATSGPYKSKWNALLAPLAVIPLFFFSDWDILFMSILVLLMNLWVAWKQLDGGDDDYSWMQFFRDQATAQSYMYGSSQKTWSGADKVAAQTFETISMLQDPMTSQNFGMYR